MDVLADTNILVRRINRFDVQHHEARDALAALRRQGHRVCIVPQNIVECWSVATRPVSKNGLGLMPSHMERIAARIEGAFHLLPETVDVFVEWKKLVVAHAVSGVKVYDARLVASALAFGIGTVLTFNTRDFRGYPGITTLHPADVVKQL